MPVDIQKNENENEKRELSCKHVKGNTRNTGIKEEPEAVERI